MLKKFTLAVLLVAAIALMPDINTTKNPVHETQQSNATASQAAQEQPKPSETVVMPVEAEKAVIPAEKPSKPPEPIVNCGPHDPTLVFNLLVEQGVPRLSAIQLLGSWKSESGLDQCQKRGDGGKAWGLNSWHPNRRWDMPEELRAQVAWAVHTELKRDCSSCYQSIMAGESVWTVRSAIQQSTRWGVLGSRWLYADQFAKLF